MAVYPNAYYNYLKNRKCKQRSERTHIMQVVHRIYHRENGVPGYRTMAYYLAREEGIHLSAVTVHHYMKAMGLRSIVRRKKPVYKKGEQHHVFENLVKRNFEVSKPNQVWCTDFTYLNRPDGSTRYNCTIIDLFSREAVASLNGAHIDSQLAKDTLAKALEKCRPDKGLILHSDQGRQFASKEFSQFCHDCHVKQSMSRAGCPYDNAPMERFYNTLKHEFYYLQRFSSNKELDAATNKFVAKYNCSRPHTHNGGLPPTIARMRVT